MHLDEKGKKDSEIENNINSYRRSSGGNYDGALIKITNFSWDFNGDGSYDISLKGVSKGGIIDSLILDGPVTLNDTLTNVVDYKITTKTSDEKTAILKKLGVKKIIIEVLKLRVFYFKLKICFLTF